MRAGRIALVLTVAACSTHDAPKIDLAQKAAADSAARTLSPEATTALDSANALFRRKRFPEALTQYRRAAAASPTQASPYFGIYMVAKATHDTALADSALTQIRARNGSPPSGDPPPLRNLPPDPVVIFHAAPNR